MTRSKNQANPVRVLIADDDPLVRAAVATLLSHEEDIRVIGEATNGDEAIQGAQQLKPDILLLDLNMPQKAGLAALRDLGDSIPGMKTIVLTLSIEKRQILEALQLGAKGIVLKAAAREFLVAGIQAVIAGKCWVKDQAVTDVTEIVRELAATGKDAQADNSKLSLLSSREVQIVTFIVEGRTNKDIARSLQTSEQVVKNHLGKIFDKLGVFNRLELALYALDNRLVERG